MASMNTVSITGRVVADGELINFGQTEVCGITLACDRYAGKDEEGKPKEETNFFDITGFGVHAKVLAQHCTKGRLIGIEGELRQEKWKDKETGQNRSRIKVIVRNITFLGRKGNAEEGGQADVAL